MWRKTCVECHAVSEKHEIAKAQTPVTWMKGAQFDHNPHGVVACTECHGKALESKATADVLLPNVATCQQCHRASKPSASASCTECHVYHDWSKAKPIDTQRKILELLNR
jgi:RecJ-like exonuclease